MRTQTMLLAALLATACQQESATAASGQAGAAPPLAVPVATASAAASPASPAHGREVNIDTDLYTFEYSYPAQAAALPALKALLDADLERHKAEFLRFAKEEQANARAGGFDYRKVELAIDWQVVTELPGWLSLSAAIYSYEGGAHPNHGYDALLWDKAAGRRLAASDLFTSKRAFRDAVQKDFCREIDKQREERRGRSIERGGDDPFDACIDPLESTVILGSSTRKAFNRIGVLVAPYAAGPYVEGDYEVTLPVDAAVLGAVKPQYRAVFSILR